MPRFIAPRTGAQEITIAEEQHEYDQLTGAVYWDSQYHSPLILVRLTFSAQERLAIAEGEDLYIGELVFDRAFTPLQVQVGPGYFRQAVVDHEEGSP